MMINKSAPDVVVVNETLKEVEGEFYFKWGSERLHLEKNSPEVILAMVKDLEELHLFKPNGDYIQVDGVVKLLCRHLIIGKEELGIVTESPIVHTLAGYKSTNPMDLLGQVISDMVDKYNYVSYISATLTINSKHITRKLEYPVNGAFLPTVVHFQNEHLTLLAANTSDILDAQRLELVTKLTQAYCDMFKEHVESRINKKVFHLSDDITIAFEVIYRESMK